MRKDIPIKTVEDIGIAVVLENETPEAKVWNVYLVNLKDQSIETVLITSRGYGLKDGEEVKTSTLRHSIGNVASKAFAKVEAIDEQVFGLTNEYWLTYYLNNELYDKKFIFLPESIVDSNFIRIPVVNKPGVMIK